jgi:hypothetical protein
MRNEVHRALIVMESPEMRKGLLAFSEGKGRHEKF